MHDLQLGLTTIISGIISTHSNTNGNIITSTIINGKFINDIIRRGMWAQNCAHMCS